MAEVVLNMKNNSDLVTNCVNGFGCKERTKGREEEDDHHLEAKCQVQPDDRRHVDCHSSKAKHGAHSLHS